MTHPKKRILYAEDDKNLRDTMKLILEHAGYVVVPVSDGDAILRKLEGGGQYDLVLTDNNMPHVSGLEALQRIRADVRYEKTPVIVLSGGSIRGQVEQSMGIYHDKMGLELSALLAAISEAL